MSTKPPPNRALLVLFSVIALDLIGFGIVIPILPFYAVQFGASATDLGLLLMSYSGMQFLFARLWGKISDRIGRKKVLVLTIGGSCVALVLLGSATSLFLLFVARLMGGLFAANISVATAYVADITEDQDRAYGMGLIGAAFGVGFILGPALGGLLSPFGYEAPIFLAAVLSSLNMMYASWILKEPLRHRAIEEGIERGLLRNRPLLRTCLTYFLFTMAVTQLETIFPLFMLDKFAFDAREVAWVLVLMALVMVGIQGGGIRRLSRRFGERSLFRTGAFLLTVSFFFVPFPHSVALLLLPLIVASVGRGISHPSLMSLVSKISSPGRRGDVMGTFQASASLGRLVGPVLAGVLYDRSIGFPFFAATALMGIVFLMTRGWRFKPEQEEAVAAEGR